MDLIGLVIKGRYKIIDELRKSFLSTTFIARDLKNNQICSVKIMHLEYSNADEFLTRFQREAYILTHLKNEHFVKAIESGEDNGIHFIITDFIDGQSLKYLLLTTGPFEPLQALNYAQQIADGLQSAYLLGIVHRDIKPQDIVINDRGIAKIIDFSLASGGYMDVITLTGSGTFIGTAYYIAPEQAESAHVADVRADLYSVAAILFEMLTGHPPFEGETAVDIVIKHMNEKVPSICQLRPELPHEVDLFMQKAMAKTPADRYSTPRGFIKALEQLQQCIEASLSDTPGLQEDNSLGHLKAVIKERVNKPASLLPQEQARLLVISNNQSITLSKDFMTIGRQDLTLGIYPDINLADKTVGRRHAYLRNYQGRYTIEDLNALHKTRLNSVILPPHEERTLKDGDVLRFGNVEVRFELYSE